MSLLTTVPRSRFRPVLNEKTRVFYDFKKFLSFMNRNSSNVRSVKIKPAKLGKKGFGSIVVVLKG